MDRHRFDRLTRSFASGASRRSVLKGLLGLGGAAAGATIAGERASARPTGVRPIFTAPACGDAPGEFECGDSCCGTGEFCCGPSATGECCDFSTQICHFGRCCTNHCGDTCCDNAGETCCHFEWCCPAEQQFCCNDGCCDHECNDQGCCGGRNVACGDPPDPCEDWPEGNDFFCGIECCTASQYCCQDGWCCLNPCNEILGTCCGLGPACDDQCCGAGAGCCGGECCGWLGELFGVEWFCCNDVCCDHECNEQGDCCEAGASLCGAECCEGDCCQYDEGRAVCIGPDQCCSAADCAAMSMTLDEPCVECNDRHQCVPINDGQLCRGECGVCGQGGCGFFSNEFCGSCETCFEAQCDPLPNGSDCRDERGSCCNGVCQQNAKCCIDDDCDFDNCEVCVEGACVGCSDPETCCVNAPFPTCVDVSLEDRCCNNTHCPNACLGCLATECVPFETCEEGQCCMGDADPANWTCVGAGECCPDLTGCREGQHCCPFDGGIHVCGECCVDDHCECGDCDFPRLTCVADCRAEACCGGKCCESPLVCCERMVQGVLSHTCIDPNTQCCTIDDCATLNPGTNRRCWFCRPGQGFTCDPVGDGDSCRGGGPAGVCCNQVCVIGAQSCDSATAASAGQTAATTTSLSPTTPPAPAVTPGPTTPAPGA